MANKSQKFEVHRVINSFYYVYWVLHIDISWEKGQLYNNFTFGFGFVKIQGKYRQLWVPWGH